MKKIIGKTFALCLSALILAGFGGCTKNAGAFKSAELIKLGNHTYYTSDLFATGRDKDYKGVMISQLEEADKELHDDVYVFGTGESEVKEKFRFFGLMMQDGVVFDSADMTCWYDEEKGHFWAIDYSKFRRTDFNKNGIINAEDVFDKVYEKASASEKALRAGNGKISGTYILSVNKDGTLYYNFTVNKYSTVGVDAKTGDIISSSFWDGIYT